MKKSIFTLVKDMVLAFAAWGICAALLNALAGHNIGADGAMELAIFFAGIPFGWRWSSKIITAASLKGIGIKLVISLILGWLAIFIVLGGDVIRCVTEIVKAKKNNSASSEVQ